MAVGVVAGVCVGWAVWPDALAEEQPPARVWQLPGLRSALLDRDPNVRALAVVEVEALGPVAAPVAPLVADQLASPDDERRRAAVAALRAMGKSGATAAPRVIELLDADDEDTRSAACWALYHMGDAANPAAPTLLRLLRDGGDDLPSAVVSAIASTPASHDEAVPDLLLLLESERIDLVRAAAEALCRIGTHQREATTALVSRFAKGDAFAQFHARGAITDIGDAFRTARPELLELLEQEAGDVRDTALCILHEVGEAHHAPAPVLVRILDEARGVEVRSWAATALLRKLGAECGDCPELLRALRQNTLLEESVAESGGAVVPALVALTSHDEPEIRAAAAATLSRTGDGSEATIAALTRLLDDGDERPRLQAAIALASAGRPPRATAPVLEELLLTSEGSTQVAVVDALGSMGHVSNEVLGALATLLDAKNPWLRLRAANAILTARPDDARAISTLRALLDYEQPDEQESQSMDAARRLGLRRSTVSVARRIRARAAARLASTESGRAEGLAALVALLGDDEVFPSHEARDALLALGEAAAPVVPHVLARLCEASMDPGDALAVLQTLRVSDASADGRLQRLVSIVGPAYASHHETAPYLLCAHVVGEGTGEANELLRWLDGLRAARLIARRAPPGPDDAPDALRHLAMAWSHADDFPGLREDLADAIRETLGAREWDSADVGVLTAVRDAVASDARLRSAVEARLDGLEGFDWFVLGWRTVALHASFWLVLLVVYPRSRLVQAVFFWNPGVRKLMGAGYVGLALTWVPPLRRVLLAPFRESLVADARLAEFDTGGYFPDLEVTSHRSGERRPLVATLEAHRGQAILVGDSGLGKTQFLRHLAGSRPARLVAFLSAQSCSDGVVAGIRARLHGVARDEDFLSKLIYAGALDVLIDGLNEVGPETRVRISTFLGQYPHANVIVSTQPFDWDPPPSVTRFDLQPLDRDRVERFLTTRTFEDAPVRGDAYRDACTRLLDRVYGTGDLPDARRAEAAVLSNPMDLMTVASLLANGHEPNLFELYEEQSRILCEDYSARHDGRPFPMTRFCDAVYAMIADGDESLPADDFADEIRVMARHRMVVRRQYESASGRGSKTDWYFRHDRIRDFFAAQTFLGSDNERPSLHIADPRFRGVYLFLVGLLPIAEARRLERLLIEHAAETKDHALADDFINRLRLRAA